MKSNPSCPVCAADQFEALGKRLYRKSDIAALPPYAGARYDVLFNIWAPDTQEIELAAALCKRCGFITHVPRPTTEDIDNKYKYLYSLPLVQSEAFDDLDSDDIRSAALYAQSAGFLGSSGAQILDFGGGNGRLLSRFLRAGHDCYLVDYVSKSLPGIVHIGNTLAEVPVDRKFDLVICSHVLEHLAEPRDIVERLAQHLAKDGVLYTEVPMEIWSNIPLPTEPVTHINFFSPPSLRALLELSGMNVLICEECTFTAPNGELGFAVRAIARRASLDGAGPRGVRESVQDVRDLIRPSFLQRARRAFRYPRYSLQEARRWSKTNIPFFWRYIP